MSRAYGEPHGTRDQIDHRTPLERHGSGLGRERRIVERTFARLHQRRRLLVRYERRADIREAFLAFAWYLTCWRRPAQLG